MDGEIEKYLRALRDAQMPAMARALELLPSMDFPQSGTLVPELARLFKLLTEEQKQFWEDVAKPKDQRRAGLTKEYMETTQGLLDVLDKLSSMLAATVNHQDAAIDQLLSIKQNAWLLRNTAGEASLIVSTGLAAGKITPEGRYDLYPICRRHERDVEGAGIVDLRHAVAAGARLRHGRGQDRLFRAAISAPCATASRTRWSRARSPR